MGSFLGFVIGLVVGVIGAWWFFERRDAQSRGTMEAGWKKKLEHVEAEVRRADAAHDETKERLRQLQQERLPAPISTAPALSGPAPLDAASVKPDSVKPAPFKPASVKFSSIKKAKAIEPAPAPTPATPSPAEGEPTVTEADRIAQARRRIDAKLAQLPAGSSARQRLMAERASLDADAGQPASGTQRRPVTPPPKAAH